MSIVQLTSNLIDDLMSDLLDGVSSSATSHHLDPGGAGRQEGLLDVSRDGDLLTVEQLTPGHGRHN